MNEILSEIEIIVHGAMNWIKETANSNTPSTYGGIIVVILMLFISIMKGRGNKS